MFSRLALLASLSMSRSSPSIRPACTLLSVAPLIQHGSYHRKGYNLGVCSGTACQLLWARLKDVWIRKERMKIMEYNLLYLRLQSIARKLEKLFDAKKCSKMMIAFPAALRSAR